jgi:flagellar biosynthesis/type III secretory pathway M-ring protein FliF/YscJ
MKNHKQQAGFGFISMIIAAGLVALLYFIVVKKYLANPLGQDKEARSALASQGINPQTLPDTVKKAEEAADKANKANKLIGLISQDCG